MLVGIHQLHYLPWLRYFEKIDHADVFVVLDNIQYNKNGWQNRNKIKSGQGALTLTVPILDSFAQNLDEVRINNAVKWRKKHWASITQNYGKAPFFDTHAPFLETVYANTWENLNALNRHMLDYFVQALGIAAPIAYASDLAVPGIATERLVGLVQAVGGNAYYSGAFALEAYLDADVLNAAGITLELQHWHAPEYSQLHGAFIPDLSILDLLMQRGPESLAVLQRGNRETPA